MPGKEILITAVLLVLPAGSGNGVSIGSAALVSIRGAANETEAIFAMTGTSCPVIEIDVGSRADLAAAVRKKT